MEKAEIIGKRIECIIGILLLIPPVLGVISFVLCLFGVEGDFPSMDNISGNWSYGILIDRGGGGAMSATPLYFGLMAIAGVWLIKDGLKYFFMKSK